ncbi:MATE family efflux transporter [Romboutsia sp. CE17]|uniref:MATE family efflux transporter n=1 Tax=Romboutsia sp. CE17 TaxID=2724150 RepID=UPI001442DE23|nr:MATE family efflux transporter [Romboutsia sp. CE17]QJA09492.1 MATE family efflux transporter [Romboutsia sp. CE17]
MINEFLKYAIPSAISMFISALYTIIDGIFVGQGVGDAALAAVNIVLPFTVILVGMANMMAVGGGSLVSKNIGSKEIDKAVNIFRQVCKFLLLLSIFISIVCVIFTDQIVKLLGATENLEGLAVDYLRFYALFSIPNLIGIVLNSFVRNDQKPKLAMVSIISGAITNIILDYVFIFKFGLGIKGAAIATGLGQIVTVTILLPHFIKKKGYLSFGKVKLQLESIKEFLKIGFPSFFAQASFSVIVLLHNVIITKNIGEMGVSAYSIINYIGTNIYMVLFGLTLGAQPLISYNYGRKDSSKMLSFYKITCISSTLFTTLAVVICFVLGRSIIQIFTSDKEILELTYTGIKFAALSYYFVGLNLNTITYYQAIEMPKYSNLICLFRSIVFLPIGLIMLSKIFGVNGVWGGTLFAETITFTAISLITSLKSNTLKSTEKVNSLENLEVV